MPTNEIGLFNDLAMRALSMRSVMQFEFDTELFVPHIIDEISVCFKHAGMMDRFVDWAVNGGAEHFNAHVVDRMWRIAILPPSPQDVDRVEVPEWFDVQYEFLHLPGHQTWRIEAMQVLSGMAPLHDAAMQGRDAAIVHASFKVPTLEHMHVAEHQLARAGLRSLAGYRNAYGVLSYWKGRHDVYVKPRVNLRDA